MKTLTKKQIVKLASRSLHLQVEVVDAVFDEIFAQVGEAVKQGKTVQFRGFGSFERKTLAAKKGYNIQTKESLDLPERSTVGFKPSPQLKDSL